MKRLLAVILIFVSACTTAVPVEGNMDVYANPEAYVGREVLICGYVRYGEGETNIWISEQAWRERRSRGENQNAGLTLSDSALAASELSRQHGRTTCTQVVVGESFCRQQNCANSEFDYGVTPLSALPWRNTMRPR